jgi:hypothetical protein
MDVHDVLTKAKEEACKHREKQIEYKHTRIFRGGTLNGGPYESHPDIKSLMDIVVAGNYQLRRITKHQWRNGVEIRSEYVYRPAKGYTGDAQVSSESEAASNIYTDRFFAERGSSQHQSGLGMVPAGGDGYLWRVYSSEEYIASQKIANANGSVDGLDEN